jgi:hypothetical protein
MNRYFEDMPIEAASMLEQLSRLQYELRENRYKLLQPYAVADEEALLQLIVTGGVAEHPAYEHYLGAHSLAAARQAVHGELKALLKEMEA